MSKITAVKAREVIDSRGSPTVEVELQVDEGVVRAIVPSGASTGKHEALELRDKETRFNGKGVLKAVDNVNSVIAQKIIGQEPDSNEVDKLMLDLDGTPNKSKLGANSILAVSMAVCKAGALAKGKPLYQHLCDGASDFKLPMPSMNIINGGRHAGNKLDIQEYMILPVGASNFKESIQIGCEVYHELKLLLKKKYGPNSVNVGDEGGFAPPLDNSEEPLNLILNAVNELGYNDKVKIGLDCAASEFYKNDKYMLDGKKLSSGELIDFYKDLVSKYPIVSIEDPFEEEDFDNFGVLTKSIGKKVQIVGDDLLVTNVDRISTAITKKACNALLLKVNQIGTVTESINAAKLAQDQEWNVMVSHRSGETEDTFIADLSVGIGADYIKAGAPCRSERVAKYNQLIRIEEELGEKGRFGGRI